MLFLGCQGVGDRVEEPVEGGAIVGGESSHRRLFQAVQDVEPGGHRGLLRQADDPAPQIGAVGRLLEETGALEPGDGGRDGGRAHAEASGQLPLPQPRRLAQKLPHKTEFCKRDAHRGELVRQPDLEGPLGLPDADDKVAGGIGRGHDYSLA